MTCEAAAGDPGQEPAGESGGAGGTDLLQVWAQVPDPRDRRGRRHSLTVMFALVQAAIVSGATTWAAVRHWITVAPEQVLQSVGARRNARTGVLEAPHPDTVYRTLTGVDPAQVDAAYARYRAAQVPDLYDDDELIGLTVDGKTQRGTATGDGRARHRLGAMLAADAITLAQLDVDGKSNEITAFVPLLDQIGDIANMVISADMMHTQRDHARYLRRRGTHFVFPVGGNQPALFDRLDQLAWTDVPSGWTTYDRGHGRQEIRTIQVMPAPGGLKFPHVKQVFLVERHFYGLDGEHLSGQAVLGVTSLTAAQADARRLAGFVRGEWSIENRDHYIRDVTLGEDRCRVRAGALPSVLAVMRSHAIGALRLLGFTNIAEATRWARDDFTHPLIALGLNI
ncbi:ISAs1 family transposase [Actinomadura sp. 7K507]|uniref:ISAs1 family transposase n=1 Tax=Actinomadura sp. 7K507 TaxID=2530365 RepID=UPI001404DE85|nr:ISAs1 family transposase [Actinomadura sp. 7K507]